jgi:DNA adenine methylase
VVSPSPQAARSRGTSSAGSKLLDRIGGTTHPPGSTPKEGSPLKPIIKWPGGKSREIPRILEFVPPVKTWVEPFVGGGALFFRLEPAAALLNDASEDLVGFYMAVKEGESSFRESLDLLSRDREELKARAHRRAADFAARVASARVGNGEGEDGLATAPGDGPLELPAEGVDEQLRASVRSKVGRLLGLENKHGKVFGAEELPQHFETALQAGYYTAVRDRWRPRSRAGRLARFYFLRELCYGSMFRYGKDGRFNIPYGGISYNRVDLARKVTRLFSPDVRSLLARAELTAGDFEAHLASIGSHLGPDAFVFLDPPYDTEFSDYANRGFGKDDHERLAAAFARLPCAALLVIQETEFVRGLYEELGRRRRARGLPFGLHSYGKTYGYNVRGRNERRTTHLLVLNYDPPPREGQMELF